MAITDKERTQIKDAIAIIERETATDGASLVLKGFGTFKRKQSAAKVGRNPQTGGTVQISAKSKLAFSPSPAQVREV